MTGNNAWRLDAVKIREMLWQNRRDFKAVLECEGCGNTEIIRGYDDDHYHNIVIPDIKCGACGKTGAGCGADYRPLRPKYPEWMVV